MVVGLFRCCVLVQLGLPCSCSRGVGLLRCCAVWSLDRFTVVLLGCGAVVELGCCVVSLLCYWLLYTVGLLDSCVAVLLGC